MRRQNKKLFGFVILLIFSVINVSKAADPNPNEAIWSNWGGNLHNTNYQKAEDAIGPDNVGSLELKGTIELAPGEVNIHAFPTVIGNTVYFVSNGPFAGGSLSAYNINSRQKIWSNKIASYSEDLTHNWSRTSPAIYRNTLVIGTQLDLAQLFAGFPFGSPTGAYVIAVNRMTGERLWKVKVHEHPAAIITQSPTIHAEVIYVGVSSMEEAFSGDPFYECCTFRGKMLALSIKDGSVLWTTPTIPPPPEGVEPEDWFSGNSIWGSSPAVDLKRKAVYIATGNNYKAPQALLNCISAAKEIAPDDPFDTDRLAAEEECLSDPVLDPPENYVDAIVAFDMNTGKVKWSQKLQGFDAWNVGCGLPGIFPPNENCPNPAGPDFDFGQSPMLITVTDPDTGLPKDLVVAGQKSGFFWALDPDKDGKLVWFQASVQGPGPLFESGGLTGGHQWGAASDGKRIYVQDTNEEFKEFILKAGSDNFGFPGAGDSINTGSWSALDAATGDVIWTVPNLAGWAMGPVSAANGVVYAGSMFDQKMYAFDAKGGEILWTFTANGHVMSAPTIHNGKLLWGAGYSIVPGGEDNKLYIFGLPE